MFRWVFVVLAFAAMMVYGSVIYAEEAKTPTSAPETTGEVAAPATTPADVGDVTAPADTSASAPADPGTKEAAPVTGGGSCGGCGGK